MATIDVFDSRKNAVGQRELAEPIFNGPVKDHLLQQMVRYQLAKRRQGTASAKTRSEVAGGSKKPYRQKGTGNARQGCIRAPHFVGGGAAFGPKPRDYTFKLNRKVKKAALRSVLSSRYQEQNLMVLDALTMANISTKDFVATMAALGLEKPLIVVSEKEKNLELSARNVPGVTIITADGLNVYDILHHKTLLMTVPAVERVEKELAQ